MSHRDVTQPFTEQVRKVRDDFYAKVLSLNPDALRKLQDAVNLELTPSNADRLDSHYFAAKCLLGPIYHAKLMLPRNQQKAMLGSVIIGAVRAVEESDCDDRGGFYSRPIGPEKHEWTWAGAEEGHARALVLMLVPEAVRAHVTWSPW